MKRLLLILVLLGFTAVSCSDRYGVISGIFRLREDSPLPSWLVLPRGMTRDQVNVTIMIYESTYNEATSTWNKSKVRFIVFKKHRWVSNALNETLNKMWIFNKIQEQMGEEYWHPDSLRQNPPGGTYPNWIIIEVNGTKEVYESSEPNDLLGIVKKTLN
jgi:hypothetical protein